MTDRKELILIPCNYETIDTNVIKGAQDSLAQLKETLNYVQRRFEICWVFTFELRNQLIASIATLKSTCREMRCETLNEYFSLLEFVVLRAFQSESHKDGDVLRLLSENVQSVEIGPPQDPERNVQSLRTRMDSMWSWIEN